MFWWQVYSRWVVVQRFVVGKGRRVGRGNRSSLLSGGCTRSTNVTRNCTNCEAIYLYSTCRVGVPRFMWRRRDEITRSSENTTKRFPLSSFSTDASGYNRELLYYYCVQYYTIVLQYSTTLYYSITTSLTSLELTFIISVGGMDGQFSHIIPLVFD